MHIKCDLKLQKVEFDFWHSNISNAVSMPSYMQAELATFTKTLTTQLFTKSSASTLNEFMADFKITSQGSSVVVELIGEKSNNNYSIPNIIELALGFDVSIKKTHTNRNLLLEELALIIIKRPNGQTAFLIDAGHDFSANDPYRAFEFALLRHIHLDSPARFVGYFSLTDRNKNQTLNKKLLDAAFEHKYGAKASESALSIQSLFRGHSTRKRVGKLKDNIKKAVANGEFSQIDQHLNDLRNGAPYKRTRR